MFTAKNGKLLFEAVIHSVRSLTDRSLSITLHTQEVPKGQGGLLIDLNQQFVAVMIKPHDEGLDQEDWDDLEDFNPDKFDISKDKSPSKLLRNTLFIRWKLAGKPGGDFDFWYVSRINRYIEHEKVIIKRLDPSKH